MIKAANIDLSFVGAKRLLDAYDIPRLAHRANLSEDHFRAFFKVEAAGKAFDSMGRPTMLFEPHVFYRGIKDPAIRDVAVSQGLAYAKYRPGKYPRDSYPRLMAAIKLDQEAALKACSIGLSQVLVENHVSVGYDTPEAMWQAFMDDEEEHVEAMLRFILANNIDDDLRAERWSVVARVYNGPRYAENQYDKKMAAAFAAFKKEPDIDWAPDAADPDRLTISTGDAIKSVQERLIALGYPEVGKPDGSWGTKTRAAVLGFRADNGLPIVADIDSELMAALMLAAPREIGEARANTTAADLKEAGSRKIIAADKTEVVGYATAASGVAAVLAKASESVTGLKALSGEFSGVMDTLKSLSPWLLVAIGAYIAYQQLVVKRAAVEDYRTGRYVGR